MILADAIRKTQALRAAAWSRLFVILIIGGLAIVLVRVGQLKLQPSAPLRAAMTPRISTQTQHGRRGDLLDARGRVLATSTIGYRLFVDPTQVRDPGTIASDLAGVIGVTADQIERRISSGVSPQNVVIEDLLDDRQVNAVRDARLRGVGLEPRQVRHYPHGDRAARVIGLVGFDHTGLSGSEHVYDGMLAPRQGRLTYLRDVHRRTLWFEAEGYEPAADGRDVRLTIDLVVQEIAERYLRAAVERFNAGGGRVVVLDTRLGEILAMADVLADRPDRPGIAQDPARGTSPALGRNRCVTDPYEPGSTLKPVIWAAAT